MANTQTKSPDKPNELGQKGLDYEERQLERINVETPFSPNADRNITALAETGFADLEQRKRYKEKIIASLKAHLKDDVSIDDLWKYLEKNYCQTTAIIEGILRFFAGSKGENEIGIAKFLKPVEIPADPMLRTVLDQERAKEIDKTKTALNDLLAEIKANNPTLAT